MIECSMSNAQLFLTLTLVSTLLLPTQGGFKCEGLDDCCTPENLCGRFDGDCDVDEDCEGNLECGLDNCWRARKYWVYKYNWGNFDDCCCDPNVKGECGCFSLEALVTLSSGHQITLSKLKKGDLVKTLNNEGKEVFTPFLGWADKNSFKVTSFLNLTTENGSSVVVTAHHFLMSTPDPEHPSGMKRADEVAEGDFLLASSGLEKVSSISRVTRKGRGSPLTTTGDLLVNGVLSSNYAHAPSHSIAHLWMTPFRWLDLLSDEETKEKDIVRRYTKLGSHLGDLLLNNDDDLATGKVHSLMNIELLLISYVFLNKY